MWGSKSRQLKEAGLKSNVIHAGKYTRQTQTNSTTQHRAKENWEINTHKVIRERDTVGENKAQVNTIIYEPKLNTTHAQETIKINQETNTETKTKTHELDTPK